MDEQELFATSSGTHVFNASIPYLKASDELNSILRQPHSYHGDPPQNRHRRNRNFATAIVRNPSTGKEEKRVIFYIQAAARDDPKESIVHRIKRWLRPLIVEPANGQSLADQAREQAEAQALVLQQQQREQAAAASSTAPWYSLSSWFGAILPAKGETVDGVASSPSRSNGFVRQRPSLGQFDGGEVTATLVQVRWSRSLMAKCLLTRLAAHRSVRSGCCRG